MPFPIPRDGSEVMWNHRLRFVGRAVTFKYDNWLVTPSGQRSLMTTAQSVEEYPAFDAKQDRTLQEGESWLTWKLQLSAPQRRAGEATSSSTRSIRCGSRGASGRTSPASVASSSLTFPRMP